MKKLLLAAVIAAPLLGAFGWGVLNVKSTNTNAMTLPACAVAIAIYCGLVMRLIRRRNTYTGKTMSMLHRRERR
ncbi:hypothetical protein [Xanthomonas euvesicatoria]|uniref:hypothetical protein n=1 Tax=Xanthomonas euvesicatoria TaxID=456327 RepID=UPI00111278D4|nr:hypothetical protein [Xanthomonas euvesicatoria]